MGANQARGESTLNGAGFVEEKLADKLSEATSFGGWADESSLLLAENENPGDNEYL